MTIEFWMGSMMGTAVTAVIFLIGYLIELRNNLQEVQQGSQPLNSEDDQERQQKVYSRWKKAKVQRETSETTDSP